MKIVFALLLSVAISSAAHGSATKRDIMIDCADAPTAAVLELPEILADWAQVRCTIYGDVILPSEDWRWAAPTGWAPVFFPAQRVKQPVEVRHEKYFSSITFVPIDEETATKAFQLLQPEGISLGGDTYQMIARTESGVIYSAYFFDVHSDEIWAYACTPECRPDLPFVVRSAHSQ